MASELVVHGFETSNNMKVRVALGFKNIPYEWRPIEPRDRTGIFELSGQYLTPVMVHGDRVLFDSATIIRYLEANFRDRPGLFGTSHREQWEIEDHELFARAILAAPMTEIVHHRVYGGTIDDAMKARCGDVFAGAAGKVIERLSGREWLVGESMSVADVTTAAVIYRVQSARPFDPPSELQAISGWIDRVMAYDEHLER